MPEILDLNARPWLRPALLQSVLASARARVRGSSAMEENARHVTLDCGNGIRTVGQLSRHPQERGFVVMLHGWMGTPDAAYVVATARRLYAQGYSVFRLTLLEHGETVALNPAYLHAGCLEELFVAVRQAFDMVHRGPGMLVGYSLGGNFALRVACKTRGTPIAGLDHVFAVSPVISPAQASRMMDQNPLIKGYFRRELYRWATTKEAAFPDLFQMEDVRQARTIAGISKICIDRWTGFDTVSDYFDAYTIGPDDFIGCPINVTAISAIDDPVVPGADLLGLTPDACLETLVFRHGGHNGFFRRLAEGGLYDALIEERLGSY